MKQPNQYRRISRGLLGLTCLLGSLASLPSFAAYTLVDLGKDVAPKDINSDRVVVGSSNTAQYPTTAFRYDTVNGFVDLEGTVAYAINDAGAIAGNTLTGAFVLDTHGTMHIWDEQGAYGINETGLVSGNVAGNNPYRTTSTPYNPTIYEGGNHWTVMDIAQVYPRGTRQGVYADIYLLDDVNDSGIAVGSRRRYGLAGSSAIMISPPYGDIKDAADVTYLPTPSGGVASAINNSNIVVGTTGNNSRVGEYSTAFIYDGNGTDPNLLGTLGGLRSYGLDINESNTVVGSSDTDTDILSHAFIREDGRAMVDLNHLGVDNADDWILMSANAINDSGDIVGTGQMRADDGTVENHGFLLVNGDAPTQPRDNQPPVAVATADRISGKVRLRVKFKGDDSYDPDGDPISYHWDFGDGKTSTNANPRHTYRDDGNYTVVLTVTDDLRTHKTTLEITVLPRN